MPNNNRGKNIINNNNQEPVEGCTCWLETGGCILNNVCKMAVIYKLFVAILIPENNIPKQKE